MLMNPSFLFGVIVGVALALLFAPAPGDETRQKLRRYWEED
jgi:gas vesicle protein